MLFPIQELGAISLSIFLCWQLRLKFYRVHRDNKYSSHAEQKYNFKVSFYSLGFKLLCTFCPFKPTQTHLVQCPLLLHQHQTGWAPPPSLLLQHFLPDRKTNLRVSGWCFLWSQNITQASMSSYHDGMLGKCFPHFLDKLHKVLRIAVGHVQTDVPKSRDGF